MTRLKLHHYLVLSFALLLSFHAQEVQAVAPQDFGREYGLFVHEENKNLAVPEVKGVEILGSYFAGAPMKASASEDNHFMSQHDFILQFEKLRLSMSGKQTKLSDEKLYEQAWLKARRNNWLPNTKLTYQNLQEFLYRYEVSKANAWHPYYDGLVLDTDEINTQRFTSLNQVREVKGQITEHQEELQALSHPTGTTEKLLLVLNTNLEAFNDLEAELRIQKHPLNLIPDLPQDIRDKILANDLNEVLASVSYNYSKNNANRIHNLLTGVMQMNGRVYQPGEVIDFTEELGRDGWGIYKYGWVIFGGVEAWQFGGGLCGSATMTFTPSWQAGLEIITRYPHSIYYSSLYPEESLGLDATIYRGVKNLVMKNSTDSPILYYVKDNPEKKEVTLYLIGNSPYSQIEIEGPTKLGTYSYKWTRRMHRFDGTIIEDEIRTSYGRIY